jgi:pyruvate dehydrogenase E2 component (dihydrolipoamide acetyltransferase)
MRGEMFMAVEKILIPDFGDVQQITVVEVFVRPGDSVAEEDSLISLESEKAVMDIPSPCSGTITEVLVKGEDSVKSGDVIALIETGSERQEDVTKLREKTEEAATGAEEADQGGVETSGPDDKAGAERKKVFHATPSVRAFARELGVDLATVSGSGPRGRILKEDVENSLGGVSPQAVSVPGAGSPAGGGGDVTEDYARYGEVEEMPFGRIKKISGPHLHRSWTTIPHVTHFDEAGISELEKFRKSLNGTGGAEQFSYSPLVFVIKAVTAALKEFPAVNRSIMADGTGLVLKKFYHIGIAVDTPEGLVVPTIRNADTMGIRQLAAELARLSADARNGKLSITDMQGATFTVSSLGGIGGTGFTPIVSSPQAAILGLSRNYMKPVWDGERFVPQLTLPFSLSYDHRIIDGAEAARFCRALRLNLEDLKRILL